MKKVLIIDDDDIILMLLTNILEKSGFDVLKAVDGATGISLAQTHKPDVVVTDFKMPGKSGIDVLKELSVSNPGMPVIFLTAHGDVSVTIKSIQAGAFDYIEKPIKPKEFLEVVRNGVDASIQSQTLTKTIPFPARKAIEENLLAGKTPVMREIFKNIGRISLNRMGVLITGESGTGKKQIARLIHYSGVTRENPLMIVNCDSSTESYLEKEIFGLTGDDEFNKKSKPGKLELADEGTIYIEEFTNLPLSLQGRLLKVIHDGEISKTLNEQAVPFKARLIASSTRNLEELVENGQLLKELYYHIKVFSIGVPPLRERLDDIPELVNQIVQRLNRKLGRNITKIEEGLIDLLKKYEWPGNIMELENLLTQAVILSRGDVLEKTHIHINIPDIAVEEDNSKYLVPMEEIEREHILRVLNILNWNKVETSRVLEITRPTLNAKIVKYNINKS
jgi:two-component system response regulator AtoC